jgi:mannose-6-phosphate isomerase-like protein (cupin superfamily)
MASTDAAPIGREEQTSHYRVASRRWIAQGSDVFVKVFVLAPGEEVPWHSHSAIADTFFVLEGRLGIERAAVEGGERLATLDLGVGEEAQVEAGVAHRPFNADEGPCRFVLVQGVGAYDYRAWPGGRR